MDRTITAREANRHFAARLRDVRRGEGFVVTSRGRPVARVVPVDTAAPKADVDNLLVFLDGLARRGAGARIRDDLLRMNVLSEDMQPGFVWRGLTVANPLAVLIQSWFSV